jgi:hypothetical protein
VKSQDELLHMIGSATAGCYVIIYESRIERAKCIAGLAAMGLFQTGLLFAVCTLAIADMWEALFYCVLGLLNASSLARMWVCLVDYNMMLRDCKAALADWQLPTELTFPALKRTLANCTAEGWL